VALPFIFIFEVIFFDEIREFILVPMIWAKRMANTVLKVMGCVAFLVREYLI
jgi:hypothetical protein